LAIFKDTSGHQWPLSITVNSIRKVKKTFDKIDLSRVIDDKSVLATLLDDPVTFVDVLWLLCEDSAPTGVTDYDFGSRINGEVLDQAYVAFTEALIAFFPKRQRGALAKITSTIDKLQDEVMKVVNEEVNNETVEQMVKTDFRARLKKELGNLGSQLGESSTN